MAFGSDATNLVPGDDNHFADVFVRELAYYRDPNQLQFCPASSTFKATQSGRVEWSL